jgi:hypothetical protein
VSAVFQHIADRVLHLRREEVGNRVPIAFKSSVKTAREAMLMPRCHERMVFQFWLGVPEAAGKEWLHERRFERGIFMKILPQRFTRNV